jgi:hypothetical protein
MDKKWWSSKTIWANAIMLIATGLEVSGVTNVLTAEVQAQVVTAVMAVVNVVLRFVTKEPVS